MTKSKIIPFQMFTDPVVVRKHLSNDRVVTLVATIRRSPMKPKNSKFVLIVDVGFALKCPRDTDREDLGQTIASGRAERNPTLTLVLPVIDYGDNSQTAESARDVALGIIDILWDKFAEDFTEIVPFSARTRNIIKHNPETEFSAKYFVKPGVPIPRTKKEKQRQIKVVKRKRQLKSGSSAQLVEQGIGPRAWGDRT